jgi:hypothetical protein
MLTVRNQPPAPEDRLGWGGSHNDKDVSNKARSIAGGDGFACTHNPLIDSDILRIHATLDLVKSGRDV